MFPKASTIVTVTIFTMIESEDWLQALM